MTTRSNYRFLFFFVITIISCRNENSLISKSSNQTIPPAQESYVVNSRGDSILTGTPIVIEGNYIPIDANSVPEVLPVQQEKVKVQMILDQVIPGLPEIVRSPRFDTMQYLKPGSLTTIPSKGDAVVLKYPEIIESGEPDIMNGAKADITYWGIDQNMSTSSIWTMIQDRRGDFWFGTIGGGAIRFNGNRFDHFSENEGLGGTYVFAIYEDNEGNIWFGTTTGGVARFDGQSLTRFTTENGLPSNFVLSIIEDSEGDMWFGTKGGLCRYNGEQFTHYTTREGLAFDEVISIYEDSKQQLWVGTGEGSGMHVFDGDRFVHFNVGAGKGDNDVHSTIEDSEGNMWFGTWGGGVIKYDGVDFEKFTMEQGLPGNNVLSILEDHEGALWFGCLDGGVTKYDGQTFIHYTREEGLSSNSVKFLFEDKDKNIWACTWNNGVNRINPKGYQQFDQDSHLNFGEVESIVQGKKGDKWFGTPSGLFKFDGTYLTHISNSQSIIDNSVITILEDNEQNLWLGAGSGVSVLSKDGLQDYTRKNGFFAGDVRAILQDKTGHIWLGTGAGGVIRFDGLGFTQYSEQEGFISDIVISLHEDSKGHLWFGTRGGGVCRYDGNTFTIFTTSEGLSHNIVRSILEDNHGNMWFGTDGGLTKYDEFTFTKYTTKEGLIHNRIYSMILYGEKIWATTQKGISIFKTDDIHFINLDKSDGLGQHNLSVGEIVVDDHDKLWMGTIEGVLIFDADQFEKPDKVPLQLKLTDIKVNDKSIDYRSFAEHEVDFENKLEINGQARIDNISSFYNLPIGLALSHQLNHLTFYCSAIDWNAPGKISYSFFLEGVDKDWSTPQREARMDYRNLPFGNFNLKVRAKGLAGVWSDSISYNFRIAPPWWHTWTAYALYLLISIIGIYYIYKFLLERKLAIAEGERLKEIDEVKTSIYTNITHEFRTPLTVINGMVSELEESSDESILYKSGLIKRNSQKLLVMVNQLLQLSKLKAKKEELNLQQADIILFIKYLVASFDSLAFSKEISLQFYSREEILLMDFDAFKIETVLTNLISNAIKFTRKYGKIQVVAEKKELDGKTILNIGVKDSGIGISDQELPFIFDRFHQAPQIQNGQGTGIGLAVVKELVILMKGKVAVESVLGEGSRFIVQLPIERKAPLDSSIPPFKSKNVKTPAVPLNELESSEFSESDLPVLLIIEDSMDIFEYLQHCLKDQYQLLTCRNGDQGIDEAIQSIPDIIISDVMMPGKSGFELCKVLKEDNRTSHIPIILLTAKVGSENKMQGLASGADAYLTKPFEKEELLIRLDNLLQVRKTLQEKYLEELKYRFGPGQVERGESDDFLCQVEGAISENLSNDDFSVNALAGMLHLSRSQLNRKIKASTGLSTSLYIRHIRLLEAQKLLRNSDLTVSEILYQVGFNSPAYFSQAYKNLFGINPSAERGSSIEEIK